MNGRWMWMAMAVCTAGVSALPVDAEACGSVVPVDGETASLDAQRVTMAYFEEENRTRVMAQIGYQGDLSGFSWIIPLPSEPTAVQAVDEAGAAIFADLDIIGEPEFFVIDNTCAYNGADGGASIGGPGVEILQHGNTGAFEYVVLSGTGGSVVTEWLADNGYGLPSGMDEVIHTYIREGSVFMAMKVDEEALANGQIDPAISFDYEGWPGYPLRILEPGAAEEVEIILNVLAPTGAEINGEVVLDNGSLQWEGQEPQYLDAIRRADGWVVEHRGLMGSRWVDIDGSYEEVAPPRDLMEEVLGIPTDSNVLLTRFHGMFKPGQLTQDVSINMNSEAPPVYYGFELDVTRSDEVCGWDDGEGNDDDVADPSELDGDAPDKADVGGCATTSGGTTGPLVLLFGFWLMRRRRPASRARE